MSLPSITRVSVLLAENDPYSAWFLEAVRQIGILHEAVSESIFDQLGQIRTLALCGNGRLTPAQKRNVESFLIGGGTVVCCGSTWGIDDLLGLDSTGALKPSGRQWLVPKTSDRLWNERTTKTLAFGCQKVQSTLAHVIASYQNGDPALTRFGRTIYLGPHLGQTMALMMMGRAVECDSVGPGDGSAFTEDGILRAEDGTSLSFKEDRKQDTPVQFFHQPYADTLRDIWARCLVEAVETAGGTPAILWHWPNAAEAAATCSVDCDDLQLEAAARIVGALNKFGIRAAWMVPQQGYSQDVYKNIKKWDHDIGLLFGGTGESFNADQFKINHLTISRAASSPNLMCSRPSDGRWEGYSKYYDLCDHAGAKLSMSKGGRQAGTSGFLFGTSRPFMPIGHKGKAYRVLELPYTLYSPGFATHHSADPTVVEEALHHNGCVHFVYTTSSAKNDEFDKSAQNLHMLLRQSHMKFFSPETIANYEFGRRHLKVEVNADMIKLATDTQLPGLTILVGGQDVTLSHMGGRSPGRNVARYGSHFSVHVFDLEARAGHTLKCEHERKAA